MSRSWNGKDLLDEMTALLGDTSSQFRARCLGWLNDYIFDISTRHDWGHHLTKGKKTLIEETEIQPLEIDAPLAPTVALVSGGSLTTNTNYRVLVTYLQSGGVESVAGLASGILTTTASELSINLTDISTSEEDTVIARNIYLQLGLTGNYYYHGQIDDNFTTTYSITANTESTIEPPDYESIRKLKGAPFFEGPPSRALTHRDIDQLRLLIQGQFTTGNPEYFSPIAANSIVTYPLPMSGHRVSFNYYRYPKRIYDSVDSQPDLPISLKPALKAGIIAAGYEYRDRQGQEIKKANYENALVDAINRGGRVANIEYTVRDVYGNSNGNEVG